jgi:hypothetical protein
MTAKGRGHGLSIQAAGVCMTAEMMFYILSAGRHYKFCKVACNRVVLTFTRPQSNTATN